MTECMVNIVVFFQNLNVKSSKIVNILLHCLLLCKYVLKFLLYIFDQNKLRKYWLKWIMCFYLNADTNGKVGTNFILVKAHQVALCTLLGDVDVYVIMGVRDKRTISRKWFVHFTMLLLGVSSVN